MSFTYIKKLLKKAFIIMEVKELPVFMKESVPEHFKKIYGKK